MKKMLLIISLLVSAPVVMAADNANEPKVETSAPKVETPVKEEAKTEASAEATPEAPKASKVKSFFCCALEKAKAKKWWIAGGAGSVAAVVAAVVGYNVYTANQAAVEAEELN